MRLARSGLVAALGLVALVNLLFLAYRPLLNDSGPEAAVPAGAVRAAVAAKKAEVAVGGRRAQQQTQLLLEGSGSGGPESAGESTAVADADPVAGGKAVLPPPPPHSWLPNAKSVTAQLLCVDLADDCASR